MFEQDYFMRLIHDLTKALAKMVFQIETETLSPYLIENQETREKTEALLLKAEQENISSAIQALSDLTEENTLEHLLMGLVFYSVLSSQEEAYLTEHGSTPEELKNGMKQLISRYGFSSVADTFFFE
ncbi:MAG: hypothetical protein IJ642_02970 [Oscillospiraceae bacterium]|nr:hypothetical protein [Oscillospiraceae bacterium]